MTRIGTAIVALVLLAAAACLGTESGNPSAARGGSGGILPIGGTSAGGGTGVGGSMGTATGGTGWGGMGVGGTGIGGTSAMGGTMATGGTGAADPDAGVDGGLDGAVPDGG